jgi:hypothetical protein
MSKKTLQLGDTRLCHPFTILAPTHKADSRVRQAPAPNAPIPRRMLPTRPRDASPASLDILDTCPLPTRALPPLPFVMRAPPPWLETREFFNVVLDIICDSIENLSFYHFLCWRASVYTCQPC